MVVGERVATVNGGTGDWSLLDEVIQEATTEEQALNFLTVPPRFHMPDE